MAGPSLQPVVEDLSSYILGGRSTPALGVAEAVEAERLGFRRVWVSERPNIKEAGVVLGAIAAHTSRLGVGTGAITMASRSPLIAAAIGLTIHAGFGPRCVLGLGLGTVEFNRPHSHEVATYPALKDYADIMKRLWRGEEVYYDGPAGSYSGLFFADLYDGPPPEVWQLHLGGPKASRACADPAFDGALVGFFSTPEAIERSVRTIREECERIGRDPATLRICVPVMTAAETDDTECIAANPAYGGRPVTVDSLKQLLAISCQQPTVVKALVQRNGWDEETRSRIEHHPIFQGMEDVTADFRFRNREGVMEAAELVPDWWIRESCAVGSPSECIKKLQEFRDAGADEVALYCSTPAQNADVIAAWRERPQARSASPYLSSPER